MTSASSSGPSPNFSSASTCSLRRVSPAAARGSVTSTLIGPLSFMHGTDHEIDAARQSLHIGGLDRRIHADSQLIAAELPVGLGVDDAVAAQDASHGGGVDRVFEVDRADHGAAGGLLCDEGPGIKRALGPRVE